MDKLLVIGAIVALIARQALGVFHETKWGEKAPPGCIACPKGKEGLFDTPICGMNGIAYKNYCYLELRNCIAKKLNKPIVKPSKTPTTCGMQTKMFNSFSPGPFRRKRSIEIRKETDKGKKRKIRGRQYF